METAERDRDRLAASPPASPASSSSPASPHVVVHVAEEQDTAAPTPAPRGLVPPPPPLQRDGDVSTNSSTPASYSDEKPAGKSSPPPTLPTSPARPATSPHVSVDVAEERDSATTSVNNLAPPTPPPPQTPGIPEEKVPSPPPPAATRTDHTPPRPTCSAPEMLSAANPTSHTSSRRSELFGDEDTTFKLREIELKRREQALEEEMRLAKKLHNDNEIKRRNQEIILRQWGVRMDNLEDKLATKEHEIATREHEVRAAGLRDREKTLKVREDALNTPLLQQEEQKKQNKDDNTWDKRQNMMAIGLACGLSALISMQPLFPPDYVPYIVGVFAIMWVLGTVAFPVGLFGTSRVEKDFSRHISRLTFLSFALFGLYILYIISQPPSSSSSPLSPSPAPLQPPQQSTFDRGTWFYIVLGSVALCGHVVSWVLGCRTGSDRDL